MKDIRLWLLGGLALLVVLMGGFFIYDSMNPRKGDQPGEEGGADSVSTTQTPGDVVTVSNDRPNWREAMTEEQKAVTAKMGDHPTVDSLLEGEARNDLSKRTALVAPKAFDLEAYKADPSSYLNVVEHGRALSPAKAGPGVPVIIGINEDELHVIEKGGTVELKVKVPAGMPVTFLSHDMADFVENSRTCITVAADEDGVAKVTLRARPGVTQDCRVTVASPVTSGQARFEVYVKTGPDDTP